LQNFDIHKLHLLPNAHIASTLIRSHFTVARVTGRGGRTPDVKVCQWVKGWHKSWCRDSQWNSRS